MVRGAGRRFSRPQGTELPTKTEFIDSMGLIFKNQTWLCGSLISVVEMSSLFLGLEPWLQAKSSSIMPSPRIHTEAEMKGRLFCLYYCFVFQEKSLLTRSLK